MGGGTGGGLAIDVVGGKESKKRDMGLICTVTICSKYCTTEDILPDVTDTSPCGNRSHLLGDRARHGVRLPLLGRHPCKSVLISSPGYREDGHDGEDDEAQLPADDDADGDARDEGGHEVQELTRLQGKGERKGGEKEWVRSGEVGGEKEL